MTDMQPLYDLAPALELMALGIVIALGPLAWVWWRGRGNTPVRRVQARTVEDHDGQPRSVGVADERDPPVVRCQHGIAHADPVANAIGWPL